MAKSDGIIKKGHTKGKNYGDTGPDVKIMNGGKSKAGGKTNDAMKAEGCNRAKLSYEKGNGTLKGKGM